MRKIYPPFILFLVLLLFWEILVYNNFLNSYLFPPPTYIFNTFVELKFELIQSTLQTFISVIIGYLLSIFLGLLIAVLLSLSKILKAAILPFAIFFQTVPIIAIAPLLVIYFGFGCPTVIASALIVSIFPIIANTLIALTSTPFEELELFKFYHASAWKTFFYLRLPSAYIGIYTGLRVSAGLSVIGAVAGEFVAGGGLGALIDSARTQQRIDIVFISLILLSALGLILIGFLKLIHAIINSWRPLSINLKE